MLLVYDFPFLLGLGEIHTRNLVLKMMVFAELWVLVCEVEEVGLVAEHR